MKPLLTIILAAVFFTSCQKTESTAKAAGEPSLPAVGVKLATATLRSVPVEIKAIGKVEAYASVTVKSILTGTLMKAHFAEGAAVKKGDLLFEIFTPPYEEAVRQWEANVARDKALQAQAEANLTSAQAAEAFHTLQAARYEKLAASGIGSREQADQTASEARARRTAVRAVSAHIDSVKATILADEASLANAKLNLSYCFIRSPLTGRTGDLHLKPGNIIKANDSDLVTINQTVPTYVTFAIPEIRLATLRQRLKSGGLPVYAAIPGDSLPDAQGTITFLDNSVDAATGSIRLKATFLNTDTRLWPGQFVQVRVLLESLQNAVVIPAAALQNGQTGNYVYVVTDKQTVELRPVTLGPRVDRDVAIESGLRAGEKVVTEGQLRLAPGSKVKAAS